MALQPGLRACSPGLMISESLTKITVQCITPEFHEEFQLRVE
ncbi:hypothetical protein SNOG_01383 [Parastagonospora nodorum SN15]|uniref:Uncharacterized protein n=1 Tax=Phaeosphaeria nodorum (strain SN15 / ATCC MYA-4574 / FGSC 10173) TaxID=321614 RepID=Q0V3N1_PHANO|nr:hypothetical protein SNOG_01383 [Parastagonospora nodorum SN15]EAT91032.1 hypothetical protein SNOG_01383 [Parastagonospora nodorum SN15]